MASKAAPSGKTAWELLFFGIFTNFMFLQWKFSFFRGLISTSFCQIEASAIMTSIHGKHCNAVTWLTACPGCKKKIFFFHCDCGSKVFFDELGPPWPRHDCETSWARHLMRRKNLDGSIVVEISEGVRVRRTPESFVVDQAVISRTVKAKKQDEPIIAIKPDDSESNVDIVGFVREKYAKKEVFKDLNITRGSFGAEMIGPLSDGEWGKITIHAPSLTKRVYHSYTFWVPTEKINHPRNARGVTVNAKLKRLNVPKGPSIWICNHYEILG